jgi:hypothetical protein
MLRTLRSRTAATILVLAAPSIFAGEPEPDWDRWSSFPASEAVGQDLALTGWQQKEWQTLSQEYEAKLVRGFNLGNMPGCETPEAERILRMREINARGTVTSKQLSHEYSKKLERLLTPAQWQRRKQLAWQASGFRAYRDPEVARQIGLSKVQRAKLDSIWKDSSEKEQLLLYSDGAMEGSPDTARTLTKLEQLYRDRETNIEELVTPDQKKRFEVIKGKPLSKSPSPH